MRGRWVLSILWGLTLSICLFAALQPVTPLPRAIVALIIGALAGEGCWNNFERLVEGVRKGMNDRPGGGLPS